MPLAAGSGLGPYEILAPLGAGGMGEVYRARDKKLDRDVAIKVLPESVAADLETLARFEREAKAVAALSHPNIRVNQRNMIHFADADSGRARAATIVVPYELGGPRINFGRSRWTPDGRSILYVGQDAAGRSGVLSQAFDPDRDASGARRPVAGFSQEYWTESFGLSPDGSRLTISTLEESSSIMLAEGVPGAEPPWRKGSAP